MELQMSQNKIQTGAAFALVRTDVTRTNNSSDSLHLIKRWGRTGEERAGQGTLTEPWEPMAAPWEHLAAPWYLPEKPVRSPRGPRKTQASKIVAEVPEAR